MLDAGCGYAELSLALAADGYTVVGIDADPDGGRRGHQGGAGARPANATFVQDDITSFTGFDGRFDTIIDSTLFHSLPVEARDGYLQSVHRAAAPGATYYILVFAKGAFPAEMERQAQRGDRGRVARGGVEVLGRSTRSGRRSSTPTCGGIPADAPFEMPTFEKDDKGRQKMPAFLLTAHKAG